MRSPHSFIVRPIGGRYSNTMMVDDKKVIVSADKEDHRFVNRYAEVVALPLNYTGEIEIGDTLLVHHNTFRYFLNDKGRQVSSHNYFKDDLFFVDAQQFFLYKHDDRWHAFWRYCFVRPVPVEKTMIMSVNTEQPLTGELVYGNKELEALGVYEGDTVMFEPEIEYEFDVDGEKLYRLFTNNITMTL